MLLEIAQLSEKPVSDQTRYVERVGRLFLSRTPVQGTFNSLVALTASPFKLGLATS